MCRRGTMERTLVSVDAPALLRVARHVDAAVGARRCAADFRLSPADHWIGVQRLTGGPGGRKARPHVQHRSQIHGPFAVRRKLSTSLVFGGVASGFEGLSNI